jgi:hypothetical protein
MANTKVTGDVIANGTISTVHIADDAITAAKLDSTATGITFADLAVDTDTLYVDSSNNRVGIGTTSPSQKLETVGIIKSSGSANSLMFSDRTTAANTWEWYSDGNNAGLYKNHNTASTVMTINSSGNVGITASASLRFNGAGDNTHAVGYDSVIDGSFLRGQLGMRFLTGTGGGSERMRINSSGQVGIGTTSPAYKLDVNGSISLGGSGSGLRFANGGATVTFIDENWGMQFNGDATHPVKIYNASLEIGYSSAGANRGTNNLLVSGNVGIGTTSPQRKLDVAGTALIASAGNVNKGTLALGVQTSGSGKWSVITGAHYNAASGSGNGSGSAGIMMIGTEAQNGENYVVIGGAIYEANAATNIRFYTHTTDTSTAGGSERMRITSAGNVGIGTTSPSTKLDVAGSGKFQPGIAGGDALVTIAQTNSNAYVHAGLKINAGNTNPFYIYQSGSSNTLRFNYNSLSDAGGQMVITDGGYVGIGTTNPATYLDIAGDSIAIGTSYNFSINANNDGNWGFQVQRTSGQDDYNTRMKFYPVQGSQRKLGFWNGQTSSWMGYFDGSTGSNNNFIINGGSVGIGQTSPSAKLHIKETGTTRAAMIEGNSNSQGSAINIKLVKHYPVVSSGNKLIIPFVSQGNLNSTTIVRIFGHAALYNYNDPRAFTADFAVGHLYTLTNLTTLSSTGNVSGIATNGSNIEISFTTAYTSGTANGVFVTIEYMSNTISYSIDVGNIAMN